MDAAVILICISHIINRLFQHHESLPMRKVAQVLSMSSVDSSCCEFFDCVLLLLDSVSLRWNCVMTGQ